MARPELPMLPDGTGLRFQHLEANGFEYIATVEDGRIVDPHGDRRSPSGAAREVDKIIRPDEWHDSWNGWDDWEWFAEDGWEPIRSLQDTY
ncbi:hypothetical protein [Halorarum salinum]|uniref:Uncharacterized protein n=1 Tax=Halorarum salinum TaxID=2743089 RepID=A0A7D5LAS7_9EURY|nr:hypothetical protein [Halobaculum salinum]QLG62047.1 hypothetical protein HUG12_10040 [Halobaculum salinum]